MKRLAGIAVLLFVAGCATAPPPPPSPVVAPVEESAVTPAKRTEAPVQQDIGVNAFTSADVSKGQGKGNSAHLVLALDLAGLRHTTLREFAGDVRIALNARRIAYDMNGSGDVIALQVRDKNRLDETMALLRQLCLPNAGEPVLFAVARSDPDGFALSLTPSFRADIERHALDKTAGIVRQRLDTLAPSAPKVSTARDGRIVVDLPAYTDLDALRRLFAPPNTVELHAVDETLSDTDLRAGRIPADVVLLDTDTVPSTQWPVYRAALMSGDHVTDISFETNPAGVRLSLDSAGAAQLEAITRNAVGHRIALVFEDKILEAPIVHDPIHGNVMEISGDTTFGSIVELARLLRAGDLPAPLSIVELRVQ